MVSIGYAKDDFSSFFDIFDSFHQISVKLGIVNDFFYSFLGCSIMMIPFMIYMKKRIECLEIIFKCTLK